MPAPALFVADQPTLIDKAATRKALKDCVGELDSTTKITVEGHTAGVAGADNAFVKTLSTQRATEVAALLRDLGVPAGNLVEGRRLRQLQAAGQAGLGPGEPSGCGDLHLQRIGARLRVEAAR